MPTNNSEFYTGWGSSFEEHPQFAVLKTHIDRSIQDLFLEALRDQTPEFLSIFSSRKKIEEFTNKMLRYWEESENYELCGEIQILKGVLIRNWESLPRKKKSKFGEFKDWLKSSI